MKKKLNFSELLTYWKRPLFNFGQKTSQQLTNWSIFGSLFIMYFSLAQIHFETRNSTFLKNYPVFLRENKVAQKFETFYLQLPSANYPYQEAEEKTARQKRKSAEKVWFQETENEEQKLFIDFHRYLDEEDPTYPTTFDKILQLRQKQDAINLYHTFEEITPLLLSEKVREKDEKKKTPEERQKEEEAIFHIGGHVAEQNWSAETQMFDKEKVWRFRPPTFKTFTSPFTLVFYRPLDDKVIVIHNYKKHKNKKLDRSYNFIQKFCSQYEDFLKKNAKDRKFYLYHRLFFPFEKIEIYQNNDKIGLPTLYGGLQKIIGGHATIAFPRIRKHIMVDWFNPFLACQSSDFAEQSVFDDFDISTVEYNAFVTVSPSKSVRQTYQPKKKKCPHLEELPVKPKMLSFAEKKKRIRMGEDDLEQIFQYIIALKKPRLIKYWREKGIQTTKALQHQLWMDSHSSRVISAKQSALRKQKQEEALAKAENEKALLNMLFRYIIGPKKRRVKFHLSKCEFAEMLLEIFYLRDPQKEVPSQFEQHKDHIARLENQAKLPPKHATRINLFSELEEAQQLLKMKDQIPQKLEEFRLDSVKRKRKASIFIKDTEYEPERVEYIVHKKKALNTFLKQVSRPRPHRFYSTGSDGVDRLRLDPLKRSLFKIKYLTNLSSQRQKLEKNLWQFIELIEKQYPEFRELELGKMYHQTMKFQELMPHVASLKSRFVERTKLKQKRYSFELISMDEMEGIFNRDPMVLRRYGYLKNELGEKITHKPAQKMIYFDDFQVYFTYPLPANAGEYYDPEPVVLEELVEFMRWRAEKETEIFDAYFPRFSPMLEKIKHNHFFDFHFFAEDYLLESICWNLPDLLQEFIKKRQVDRRKALKVASSIKDKAQISPKKHTRKLDLPMSICSVAYQILDFFDQKKKLQNQIFQQYKSLIKHQNNLDVAQRKQISLFHEFLLKQAGCEKYLKKLFDNTVSELEHKIEDGDLVFLASNHSKLPINLRNPNWVFVKEIIQTLSPRWEKMLWKTFQQGLNRFSGRKGVSKTCQNLTKSGLVRLKKSPFVFFQPTQIWGHEAMVNKPFPFCFSFNEWFGKKFGFSIKNGTVFYLDQINNQQKRTIYPFETDRVWFQKMQYPLTSTILRISRIFSLPKLYYLSSSEIYVVRRVLPRIPKNKDALALVLKNQFARFKKTKKNPYVFSLKNFTIKRPWKIHKSQLFAKIVKFARSLDFQNVTAYGDFYNHFLLHLQETHPELVQYYSEIESFLDMEEQIYSPIEASLTFDQLAEAEKERQQEKREEKKDILKWTKIYQQEVDKKQQEYKQKHLSKKNKNKKRQSKDQEPLSGLPKTAVPTKKPKKKQPQPIADRILSQVIAEVLKDAAKNHPILSQKRRHLKDQKKIYETCLVRRMSGYFFPDIKNLKFEQFVHRPATLEIGLKQMPLFKLAQKFPKDHITYLYPRRSPSPPFQFYHHKKKILKTRFFDFPFFEFRENVQNSSWSVFFFFSSGWITIHILKKIYQKYVKEFVESGLDILKRAGILDDVQWIKEELGFMPIDKGYRGIRHHGKKVSNIIGMNQKQRILQVSEIVWFLKTKKLVQSADPFVQIILLVYRSQFFLQTKLRLILDRTPRRGLPFSLYKILLTLRTRTQIRSILKRTSRRFFPLTALGPAPTQHQYEINKRLDQNKRKNKPTKQLRPLSFRFKRAPLLNISWIKNPAGTVTIKPKGYLFTGPPGTGKTLLVQAIAGETGVPVVTQSGGLLQKSRFGLDGCGTGARTLHKLFLRAREIAPCMIFIDEIDGIGKRRQFYTDRRSESDPMEWMDGEELLRNPNPVPPQIQRRSKFLDDHDPYWKEPEFTQTVQSTRVPLDVMQDIQFSRGARTEQLTILTQLLIELDGIHALDNIVIIGATNRLEILDPALLRPGRFQKILHFHLPDYGARMKLLKLYTHLSQIGVDRLSWEYFSKRTNGLSSADIASIVFASELTAIGKGQKHTFETLERGIDLITSFPCDPIMFRLKNVFMFLENSVQEFYSKRVSFIYQSWGQTKTKQPPTINALQEISTVLRQSYYNIGKMLLLFYLEQKQMPLAYISLWKRPKNFRFFFFTQNFHEFDQFDQQRLSKKEIEKRLVALFGGKASESFLVFLPLQKFTKQICFQFDSTFCVLNNSVEQSNLGMESDLQSAQRLLKLMVEEWYFYLERIATEKFHPILENINFWEYMEPEAEKAIVYGETLVDEMMMDLDMRNQLSTSDQKHSYRTWWGKKVAAQLNYRESWRSFLQWSRIQLSDPNYSSQNVEWVPPDEYFHTTYRTCPACMTWSHYLENRRFALSNVVLLQSFNSALKILRPFLEFIDFLSDYFLRQGCLRESDLECKIQQFFSDFDDVESLS
uniref:Cell division protein FTSH n=1 Tax=Rhipilia penicilloides TaxID=1979422 RepID=A0A2P0QHJ8_9CHLO|nr:cell division protein FTSH [Rhipilia penicilloides]ARO74240.1 cell division protein FTSH [Rhipilia penicilloides]